jgi:hypothetical protein
MLIYPHQALEKVVVEIIVEIAPAALADNVVCLNHDAIAVKNPLDANSVSSSYSILLSLYFYNDNNMITLLFLLSIKS